MARTDKTRPFRVKMAESPNNYKAVHRHGNQPCDLPGDRPLPQWGDGYIRTACYWTYTDGFVCTGEGHCCCRLCTSYWTRRWERRADRHRSRRECRDAAQGLGG